MLGMIEHAQFMITFISTDLIFRLLIERTQIPKANAGGKM